MRKQLRTAAARTCFSFKSQSTKQFRHAAAALREPEHDPLQIVIETQVRRLCLVQSLRNVCEEIRRMLDADRETDRRVENAYLLPDGSRNA